MRSMSRERTSEQKMKANEYMLRGFEVTGGARLPEDETDVLERDAPALGLAGVEGADGRDRDVDEEAAEAGREPNVVNLFLNVE